jgi:hypothetical protein
MNRLALFVLPLLIAGCGSGSTLSPIAPSVTPGAVGAGSVMPAVTVSGIVFESGAEGRRPIAGASVGSECSLTVTTDADGRYILHMWPGQWAVWVQKPGYTDYQVHLTVDGAPATLDIELQRS